METWQVIIFIIDLIVLVIDFYILYELFKEE